MLVGMEFQDCTCETGRNKLKWLQIRLSHLAEVLLPQLRSDCEKRCINAAWLLENILNTPDVPTGCVQQYAVNFWRSLQR
jgi:hypothetical protein